MYFLFIFVLSSQRNFYSQCTLNASLQWRHKGHGVVSNHQSRQYFLNRLFGRRSKKTSKLRVTGLCAGDSPGAGEFPAQMASNAENVSIWWRHHVCPPYYLSAAFILNRDTISIQEIVSVLWWLKPLRWHLKLGIIAILMPLSNRQPYISIRGIIKTFIEGRIFLQNFSWYLTNWQVVYF